MSNVKAQTARILRDWRVLCEDIGERLAGTDGEEWAARYVLNEFERAGCQNCHMETFPCRSRRKAEVHVEVDLGKGWQEVESAAVTGSSSTGGTVEGEAVWLEMPEHASLLEPDSLSNRIVIIFGALPEVVEHHVLLVKARPLAVVHVDHRLPFDWAKNDGTYPLWVKKHGFPPTVTVPFRDAWSWKMTECIRLRVQMEMEMLEGESQNVVAEIPGSDPEKGLILIGAHHDSQAGNVGADDNASGVVAILELARMLQAKDFKRTIRLVSFGAEEQLSVGSARYVTDHRGELFNIGLMINFDSIASPLGHHQLFCSGGEDLANYTVDLLREKGLHVQLKREAVPFADHFPFTVYEVPSIWFFRENFPGGRWQHHSVHDNLDNVSTSVLMDVVSAVCRLVEDAAMREDLPFARGLDPGIREKTMLFARTLYELQE
jgi:Iap family predicted aminopeptidase